MTEQKQPYKVCHVGSRTFKIYLEYDEQFKGSYPTYPGFTERPEYTDDGRPFATAEQESCVHCRPRTAGEPRPFDCGGCGWFFREQTPYDPIGVGMCDAINLKFKSDSEEMK